MKESIVSDICSQLVLYRCNADKSLFELCCESRDFHFSAYFSIANNLETSGDQYESVEQKGINILVVILLAYQL